MLVTLALPIASRWAPSLSRWEREKEAFHEDMGVP